MTLFVLGTSAVALAQGMPTFEEVDTNTDGLIDRQEASLVEGFDFDSADTNQDGSLDRVEYEAAHQE